MKSLITMSILAAAMQFSPSVSGHDKDESDGKQNHGGRWEHRLVNLSPEEREKLKAVHEEAIQDPAVQAAREKMKSARREFHNSMHAAMLKADPSIQSVLDKMPKGRGERDEYLIAAHPPKTSFRDQRVAAFGITAGEIDATNRAITCVRSEGCAHNVELRG